jgi:hypothetical protein
VLLDVLTTLIVLLTSLVTQARLKAGIVAASSGDCPLGSLIVVTNDCAKAVGVA